AAYYFRHFAPANARDFAGWSGLPEHVCRRAMGRVEYSLRQVEVDGLGRDLLAPEEMLESGVSEAPVCVLLPWVDPWLQGYRDMERFAPEGVRTIPADKDLALVTFGGESAFAETISAHV